MNKIIIYQIFTRLYGNRCQARKANGTLEENDDISQDPFRLETVFAAGAELAQTAARNR